MIFPLISDIIKKKTALMLPGLAACYTLGTLWFCAVYAKTSGDISAASVLLTCVIPFIIPDIIKIALAGRCSLLLSRIKMKKSDK